MGELTLLTAALHKGYVWLVIIAVINAAIAVYYYLCVVREVAFRDPGDRPPIRLDWPTRALCVLLIGGILALGIAPGGILDTLSTSVNAITGPPPPTTAVVANAPR
jgi:NADH-quinone oxidoreductase subunit N